MDQEETLVGASRGKRSWKPNLLVSGEEYAPTEIMVLVCTSLG